jgi:hypothetical protein
VFVLWCLLLELVFVLLRTDDHHGGLNLAIFNIAKESLGRDRLIQMFAAKLKTPSTNNNIFDL